jgi:hypothetical protein
MRKPVTRTKASAGPGIAPIHPLVDPEIAPATHIALRDAEVFVQWPPQALTCFAVTASDMAPGHIAYRPLWITIGAARIAELTLPGI